MNEEIAQILASLNAKRINGETAWCALKKIGVPEHEALVLLINEGGYD